MATTLMPLDPATSPQHAARVLPIVAHLLPDEVIAGRRAKRVRGVVIVVLGVVTVLLGSWYAFVVLQARDAEDDLKGVTMEQAVLQRKQAGFKDLTDTRAAITTINSRLAGLMADDMRWSKVLNTLRTTGTDSAVKITAVSGALKSGAATGGAVATDRLPSATTDKAVGTLTVTGDAPDKNSVARYVEALEKVDVFANVFLSNAAEVDKRVQFTLSVDITSAALGGRFSPTPAASTTAGGN